MADSTVDEVLIRRILRTSHNSFMAKFAESPFHALGRIRVRRGRARAR
jgi:hypothetical protein